MLPITYLSTEEYQVLYSNKEGWQKNEERYSEFFLILKKYIEYFHTSPQIDFSSFSFPEIIFNHELLGSASIFIKNSIFFGETIFENLTFNDKVHISGSNFLAKSYFQNITFHCDTVIMNNKFKNEVVLKELTFQDEAFFADNIYYDNLLLDSLFFSKESSFNDSLLNKRCKIKNIRGIEFMEWDDLYCINYEQCEWDDLDKYIMRKEPYEILLIELVHKIKQKFPEVIAKIKDELYQTSSGGSCFFWIEKFGYNTRDCIRKKEYTQAEKYLNFMDIALKTDDTNLKNIIEVGYVENILYDLTHIQQKEAWKYIPERTKKSYATIWSVPS